LRDPAWADDVTQAVFLLLIQRSPRISCDQALAVWLHRTTRYACANARRMQARRAATHASSTHRSDCRSSI
jgi:DNA-directed RNA polymerase specialized sigma24 family protein